MKISFVDEFDGCLGWIVEDELIMRTSHALVVDGGVWLVDPVDTPEVEPRVRALGEPRGVIQLLDRHNRDSAELARRLGVRHYLVPFAPVPGAAQFEFVRIVRSRFWREVALWWGERRVLVCGDALGTIGYFVARGERLGVHPLLRLTPPRKLARFEPEHVLCGHGAGVHGNEAAPALRNALRTARRRLPAALAGSLRRRR